MKQIKCFEPSFTDVDKNTIDTCIQSGILSFGPQVATFEKRFATRSNKKFNIGLNSASAAAYILYQRLYERCGPCRIYVPSITFVSPVWAALKNGHEVVLIDVDKNLLFDIEDYKNRFVDCDRTTIVMPILYGGVSNIDGLASAAKERNSLIVVDSAHSITPTILSDYIFFSFHQSKPICMSNGGLLATNQFEDAEYFLRARNFGREAQGDSYDLIQNGFNFYMNNLNASLGVSQLVNCGDNIKQRKKNFLFLRENMPSSLGRFTTHDSQSSYYLSTLILSPDLSSADMREWLRSKGIEASFHYPPLHKTQHYRTNYSLKNIDSLEDRIINIPIHQNLSKKDLRRIADECIHYSRSRR